MKKKLLLAVVGAGLFLGSVYDLLTTSYSCMKQDKQLEVYMTPVLWDARMLEINGETVEEQAKLDSIYATPEYAADKAVFESHRQTYVANRQPLIQESKDKVPYWFGGVGLGLGFLVVSTREKRAITGLDGREITDKVI